MGLMLPRSLALLHAWWLSSTEDLALALAHLSQGVPLVLDPDSSAGLRVEPDAVLRCSLADPEQDPDQAAAGGGPGGLPLEQQGNGTSGGRRRRSAAAGSGLGGEGPEDAEEGAADVDEEDEDGDGDEDDGDDDGEGGQPEDGAAESEGVPEAAQPPALTQGLNGEADRVDVVAEDPTAAAAQAALDAAAGGSAGANSDSHAGGEAVAAGAGQEGAGKPTAAGDVLPAPAAAGAGAGATPLRPAGKRARGGAASGIGAKKRRWGGADAEPMRPFRCVVLEARGRMPLLNLNTAAPKPAATTAPASDTESSETSEPSEAQQPSPEQSQTPEPAPSAGEDGAENCGADTNMSAAAGGGQSSQRCRAPAPPATDAVTASCAAVGEGENGSCAAAAEGTVAGSEAINSTGAPAQPNNIDAATAASNRTTAAGAGRGRAGTGTGAGRAGRRQRRRGATGGPRDTAAGSSVCRNVIFVRPPQRAELADHVREVEASPLGLPPVELLRRMMPKAAELAGWLVLPHAMLARYVLLLSNPPPALLLGAPGVGPAPQAAAAMPGGSSGVFSLGAWDGAEAGAGHVGTAVRLLAAWLGRMPLLHVGTQLMLLAGGLMTFCDLQLWSRVAAELASLRRPRRPWPRRRLAAWRVLYEGLVQPQREALLSWNITHFVLLPLLRMALPASALDVALLLPLVYSVGVLGAGNSDVAARASAALLRVARRVRRHEGGYHLMLLSVVEGADPAALPAGCRLLLTAIMDSGLGPPARAAVAAAMLEEAPALAAALAAEAQRREHAAAAAAGGAGAAGAGAGAGAETGADGGAAGGGFGPGGELAAAMQAQVAPPVDRHLRLGDAAGGAVAGAAGGEEGAAAEEELEYDSDEEDEDAAQGQGRAGGPVVLRWPAPLQLPPEVADWEDVPRGFTCAITQGLMQQPAMLVSPDLPSAPTYERAAIQQWLASQMRDPKSNTPLRSYSLLPNDDLSRAIDDWVHWRLRAESKAARRRQARDALRVQEDAEADAAGPSSGAAAADLDQGWDSGASSSGDEVGGGGGAAGAGGAGASTSTGGGSRQLRARRTRSGAAAPTRSTSVLASLARGASSLLEGGAEVVSRGVAAAAATAAAAAAVTAEAVTRQGVRRRNARRGAREWAAAGVDGVVEEGAE
eukprot:XP_001694662.1 predicted protein [Chlamydomonas reinhardtii]